jgi:hypothetical protein
MGCDFLDLNFRLEKKLGIRLGRGWMPVPASAEELTVGYMENSVIAVYRQQHAETDRGIWTNDECECAGCHLLLENVPIPGFCRRCGTPVTLEQYVAAVFRVVLSEVLAVPLTKIYSEAKLIRDLGMS